MFFPGKNIDELLSGRYYSIWYHFALVSGSERKSLWYLQNVIDKMLTIQFAVDSSFEMRLLSSENCVSKIV